MKIVANNCDCHWETCNCFRWYIILNDKRLYGSDSKERCETTLSEIKEAVRSEVR